MMLFCLLNVSLIGFAQVFTSIAPYGDGVGKSLIFLNPSFVKDYSTSSMIVGGDSENPNTIEGYIIGQDFTNTKTVQLSSDFQQKMGFVQMQRNSVDSLVVDYYRQIVDTAKFVLPSNYNSLHDFIYDHENLNCNTFEEYVNLRSGVLAWYDSDNDGNFEIWECSKNQQRVYLDTWETYEADENININNLECVNNQSLPINITQTLFNDDDEYEIISNDWVKYDFKEADMPGEDWNSDGMLESKYPSVYVTTNSQILTTSGTLVANSEYVFSAFFQIGDYVYLIGGTPVAIFLKGGISQYSADSSENSTDFVYLVGGNEMDATTFWSQYGDDIRDYMNDYGNYIPFYENLGYSFLADTQLFRIDKSANMVSEIKAVGKMHIYPNPVVKNEPVNIDLGENNNIGKNIIITSSSGQRISQTPVSKGETSVRVNTSNMSTGVYNFSVIEKDKVVDNSKVIVK